MPDDRAPRGTGRDVAGELPVRHATAAGDRTRRALLDAALALVAEGGVQAVTHRAVEQRAGVARGATRYHFGTRDDLLEALVAHVAERDHAFVTRAVAEVEGGEPTGLVQGLAALLADDREGALARFELYLHAARNPRLAPVVERWAATYVEVGRSVLAGRSGAPADDKQADDTQADAAPGDDAAARLRLLSAALDGIALHALLDGGRAVASAGLLAALLTPGAADPGRTVGGGS